MRLVPRRSTDVCQEEIKTGPLFTSWHSSGCLFLDRTLIPPSFIKPLSSVTHPYPSDSSESPFPHQLFSPPPFSDSFLFNHVSHLFRIIIPSNVVIALDQQVLPRLHSRFSFSSLNSQQTWKGKMLSAGVCCVFVLLLCCLFYLVMINALNMRTNYKRFVHHWQASGTSFGASCEQTNRILVFWTSLQ